MLEGKTLVVICCFNVRTTAQPKPTIIIWRLEGGRWERYWSGYMGLDHYEENYHDAGSTQPQFEIAYCLKRGATVNIL